MTRCSATRQGRLRSCRLRVRGAQQRARPSPSVPALVSRRVPVEIEALLLGQDEAVLGLRRPLIWAPAADLRVAGDLARMVNLARYVHRVLVLAPAARDGRRARSTRHLSPAFNTSTKERKRPPLAVDVGDSMSGLCQAANGQTQEQWSRCGCFPTARLTPRLASCSRGCRGPAAVDQLNGAARGLEWFVLHRWSPDSRLGALDQAQLAGHAQRKQRCRSRRPRAGSPTRITVAGLRSAVVCSGSTPRRVSARGTRAAANRQRRSSIRSAAAE